MFSNPNRLRVSLDCGTFTHTKQSHKAECDINNILSQYKKTGIITHIAKSTASYSDLPSDVDYQSSLNLVYRASDAFEQLPSKVRDRYFNDPGRFLAALADPSQREFLEEVGIFKKPVPAPAPVPASPSSASQAPPAEQI